MKTSLEILDRLIAFPSVSRDSNLELIHYIRAFLEELGVESQLVPNEEGTKANLYATLGPKDLPGVMLSGHTDVVPVDEQDWSTDPFSLTEKAGRLYGRGAADMKGFIACVLAMAQEAVQYDLTQPIHLAFSYDEEVGCLGVRHLIAMLRDLPLRPRLCIVGEPTTLQVITAHKGKIASRVTCRGREAHSSLAPKGLSAVHMALDLIAEIRALQTQIANSGPADEAYDLPYTTLHVGTITGGTALNIVPGQCRFDFELRHLPEDPPEPIMTHIQDAADGIVAALRPNFPKAAITFETLSSYPALDTAPDHEAVAFVKSLMGANSHGKIAFGTEGGLFQKDLGIPTVVCGPGSIAVAHKPDEYLERSQLDACDRFLAALLTHLSH
jgi:acetylornithine deacetylase